MTKTISLRKIAIIVIVLLLLLIATKQLLPYPHPKELLIDVKSVLPNFSIDTYGIEYETQIPQDGWVINEASVTYRSKKDEEADGEIKQFITQFETCEQATSKYSKLPDYEISNAWLALPDIQSESKIATRSRLTCYQSRTDLPFPFTSCGYKALYEVYVVQIFELWSSFSQIDDMRAVINEIDTKMSLLRKGCIN
jgi:hypothetical protein